MTATAAQTPHARGFGARVWGGVVAAWAVVSGVAPHVLHHVGPLAGAALLAGAGGKAIFLALGLLPSLPMLRRLYHRLGTPVGPGLALCTPLPDGEPRLTRAYPVGVPSRGSPR